MHDDFEYARYRNAGRAKIYAQDWLRFLLVLCALLFLFVVECALHGVPSACRAFKADARYIRLCWDVL